MGAEDFKAVGVRKLDRMSGEVGRRKELGEEERAPTSISVVEFCLFSLPSSLLSVKFSARGWGGEVGLMRGLSSDSLGCEECASSRVGNGDGGFLAESSRNDKSDVFAALWSTRFAETEWSSSCSTLKSGGASVVVGEEITGSAEGAADGVVMASPAKSDEERIGSARESYEMRAMGGEI